MQALLRSQSEFDTHSGRHPVYGSPKYSGKHEHAPIPFLSLHMALAPQGEGWQGFGGGSEVPVKYDFVRQLIKRFIFSRKNETAVIQKDRFLSISLS